MSGKIQYCKVYGNVGGPTIDETPISYNGQRSIMGVRRGERLAI